MILETLEPDFSICKVSQLATIDTSSSFVFVGKTDEEISIVCPSDQLPGFVLKREDGFKAFRIKGTLDFSLIGILAKISTILAENSIGIFVVSTFNTDYVFIKQQQYTHAVQVLTAAGYVFSEWREQ